MESRDLHKPDKHPTTESHLQLVLFLTLWELVTCVCSLYENLSKVPVRRALFSVYGVLQQKGLKYESSLSRPFPSRLPVWSVDGKLGLLPAGQALYPGAAAPAHAVFALLPA